MQIMHCDHFDSLTESEGHKHILLLINAFTRFTWLFPVKSAGSKDVIKNFGKVFDIFGNSSLISDGETTFTSREFSEFIDPRNTSHRLVAVAASWANGLVERINRFLKSSLKKTVDDSKSWFFKIGTIQYVINNTYHFSLKSTPSKLLLGYDTRNHSDAPLVRSLNQIAKIELDCDKERDACREIATEVSNKIREYKVYYDKRHRKPTQYNVGDYVLIRDTVVKPGENKKFKPKYKRPYQITKVLNND